MVRPTVININPVEIKYYPFMISVSRCTGSCNVLSPKICVLKETDEINDRIFNTITNKNGANAMTEHISRDCKCKINSTTSNSKQNWNSKTGQCECKNYDKWEKDYSWIPRICICENSKYLKRAADTSLRKCDGIGIVIDA